jgi:hypothetical protein
LRGDSRGQALQRGEQLRLEALAGLPRLQAAPEGGNVQLAQRGLAAVQVGVQVRAREL